MGVDLQVVVSWWWCRDMLRPCLALVGPQGADRMTVERVTRFYLSEFQTTLTKGGKYINQLDADEEKALIR